MAQTPTYVVLLVVVIFAIGVTAFLEPPKKIAMQGRPKKAAIAAQPSFYRYRSLVDQDQDEGCDCEELSAQVLACDGICTARFPPETSSRTGCQRKCAVKYLACTSMC